MPSSVVAICNRALDYLGQKTITSLDDASTAAAIMKRQYTLTRDTVLRGYPWNCAISRASLAALTDAPTWGYDQQFELPSDCLRVLNVEDDDTYEIKWRVEGRRILCDEAAPLNIRYIARVEDPSALDEMCADAIATRLAADCAISITGETSKFQAMTQLFELRIKEARRIDSIEQSQDEEIVADTWLTARL